MEIIATLNEVLLPPVLFSIVFCFVCCQLPRTNYTAAHPVETERAAVETPQPQIENAAINPSDTSSDAEEKVENLTPEENTENVPVSLPVENTEEKIVTAELYARAVAAIDSLSKVKARKLCKPLGIQQKRNGVELSKELAIANIKRVLKINPELVISTLSAKLEIELTVEAPGNEVLQIAS